MKMRASAKGALAWKVAGCEKVPASSVRKRSMKRMKDQGHLVRNLPVTQSKKRGEPKKKRGPSQKRRRGL